jgi:hypothetical protein
VSFPEWATTHCFSAGHGRVSSIQLSALHNLYLSADRVVAQLARPKPSDLSMHAVVYKDPDAEKRYRWYFGRRIDTVSQIGLEEWVETDLKGWLEE